MTLHSAPSVLYPLGRSRFLGGLLLAGWLLAAVVTLCWWRVSSSTDWRPLVGCGALLLAGWVMLTGWRRSPVGRLQWDGQRWRWESWVYRSGTALEPPSVVLDVQMALLLRLDNHAGVVWWLWAERAASPERWLDLRRAVHARHRPTVSQDSEAANQALGELAATVEHPHSAPARHS
jgi:toxin CptA